MNYNKYRPFFSDSSSKFIQIDDEMPATFVSTDTENKVIAFDFDTDYGITYFEVKPSGFRLEGRINQNPPNCFVGFSLDKKMRFEAHMHPATNDIICVIFKNNETNEVVKYEISGYKIDSGYYLLNKNRVAE